MEPVVVSISENQRVDVGGNVEFSAEIDHIGTAAVSDFTDCCKGL